MHSGISTAAELGSLPAEKVAVHDCLSSELTNPKKFKASSSEVVEARFVMTNFFVCILVDITVQFDRKYTQQYVEKLQVLQFPTTVVTR